MWLGGRHQHRAVAAALGGDGGGEIDRQREHQAAGGVGVVADEVDPAGRDRRDHRAARSCSAASSGATGFTYSPLPTSAPATYRMTPGARCGPMISTCSHAWGHSPPSEG